MAAAERVLNTVYLGTSQFAGAVLRKLKATRYAPSLVVSRPDRPSGRGRRLTPPPTIEIASELGIDVFQPESVNTDEARERIAAADPQILIVCAFGALIKEPLLSQWPILNVHPSLLPRWRGAAPIERAIMAGDADTGVSIMRLTAGLDSGPVCLQQRAAIDPEDDYGTLAGKLEQIGSELLIEALELDARDALADRFTEQPEQGVTYAEKITADDRRLDPARSAAEQARQIRALSPHIGAYRELADGTRLGIWQAELDGDELVPLQVQPPGKKRMAYTDYLRGQRSRQQ
jgi:methionyl-tRNA formyltransferase